MNEFFMLSNDLFSHIHWFWLLWRIWKTFKINRLKEPFIEQRTLVVCAWLSRQLIAEMWRNVENVQVCDAHDQLRQIIHHLHDRRGTLLHFQWNSSEVYVQGLSCWGFCADGFRWDWLHHMDAWEWICW